MENTVLGLALFMLYLAFNVMLGIRQAMFLKCPGYALSFKSSFRIVIVGQFYNNLLPGGVGGDAVRIYLLKKEIDAPLSVVSGIVVMERVIGLYTMLLIALAGMLEIFYRFPEANRYFEYIWYFCLPLVGAPLIMVLLRSGRVQEWRGWQNHFGFLAKYFSKFMLAVARVALNGKMMLRGILLSMPIHILSFIGVALLASSLYGRQAFWPVLSLCPIVSIIGMLPVTPGGIGWKEAIGQEILALVGVPDGATLFMLYRLLFMLFTLICGVFCLRRDGERHVKQSILDESQGQQ